MGNLQKKLIMLAGIMLFIGCDSNSKYSNKNSDNNNDTNTVNENNINTVSVKKTNLEITLTSPVLNIGHFKEDDITITFSKELEETTANTSSNIKLKKKSDGSEIISIVTYNNKTVTVNPNNSLGDIEEYELSISTDVKDIDGNTIASQYTLAVKTYAEDKNLLKYGLVKSPHSSKIWLDRNLGATQSCTTSNDAACFGDYFQWGRTMNGHEKYATASTSTIQISLDSDSSSFIKDNSNWKTTYDSDLWTGVNAVNNPCPSGFMVPNKIEFEDDTLNNGVIDSATAFSNFLKLPEAGYRKKDGTLSASGFVWNSTLVGTIISTFYFSSSNASMAIAIPNFGLPVRCIKN